MTVSGFVRAVYYCEGDTDVKTLTLTPTEYLDDVEPDEDGWVCDLPRLDHPWHYLPRRDRVRLNWMVMRIEIEGNPGRTVRVQLLGDRRSTAMVYAVDDGGGDQMKVWSERNSQKAIFSLSRKLNWEWVIGFAGWHVRASDGGFVEEKLSNWPLDQYEAFATTRLPPAG